MVGLGVNNSSHFHPLRPLPSRYYDQLCAIENKLPMTSSQNIISFKWKDAFAKSTRLFSGSSSMSMLE